MFQKTINNSIEFSGYGLHTGLKVNVKMFPSEANTGIIFKRVDLDNHLFIEANLNNVVGLNRGTTLGKNGYKIHTVEHLLSAINGLEIDNVLIEIDNSELPIIDGSSSFFVKKILESGIKELDEEKKCIIIDDIIEYNDNKSDSYIKILPYNGFKISFEIDFKIESIGNQNHVLNGLQNYKEEISTCRTFCVFEEISKLQESNLAIGGNLDNAVIFSDKSITIKKIKDFNKKNKTKINESIKKNNFTINNKKLFFDNEPVRHKILDLIGDFSLLGKSIKGHIISYKGSHKVNIDILNKIDKIMINKNKNNDSFQYNKEEIQNFIPHRKPFLFIDKIIDGKNGEYVCAIKYVNKKENYFNGHFPGEPILPGVLVIESMAQTSCFLDMKNSDNRNKKLMLLTVIKSAKFFHRVKPGDKLFIRTDLIKYKLGTARVKGVAKVNNKIVAEAEWMATMVNKSYEYS